MQTATTSDSLELRLERIDRSADFFLENVKRFEQRTIIPLWQNYIEGRICLNVDLSAAREATSDNVARATFYARCRELDNDAIDPCGPAPLQGCKFPMLVWIGDVTQHCRPFDSEVRLAPFDSTHMFWGKPFEIAPCPVIEPCLRVYGVGFQVLDNELRSVLDDAPAIIEREFVNDIVESGPQMVDNRTYQNGSFDRNRGERNPFLCTEVERKFQKMSGVIILERIALVWLKVFPDDPLQFLKVSIGPVYMS